MAKPYSMDLRERVVAAMATGRSCREVGAAFDVAPSTAGNWWRRYRRESSHAARPMGGDRRSKLLQQACWIGERLAGTPELTPGEVRSDLARRGIVVSYASVWRTVRKLELRHKKRTIFATEQDRPDVAVAHEIWRAAQVGLDFDRLVFVDETGTTTSMTRLRGWGRKGKPLLGKAPHGHWMTLTFVAGLRHDGIAAPMLIDTPMAGRIFQQWLTDHLIPELPPGSIVVCDNLAAHKVDGVRQCLEDAGMGLLYLPPPAFAGAGSTAPTSTRSSRPLPRSRRCSGERHHARSVPYSTRSSQSSSVSVPPNAQTASDILATCKPDRF